MLLFKKIISPNICRKPAACKMTFKPYLPCLIRLIQSWRLADPEIHLYRTNRHSAGTKSEHIVKIILSAFLHAHSGSTQQSSTSPASETRHTRHGSTILTQGFSSCFPRTTKVTNFNYNKCCLSGQLLWLQRSLRAFHQLLKAPNKGL